jgi:hypothetical protein
VAGTAVVLGTMVVITVRCFPASLSVAGETINDPCGCSTR